MTLQDKQKIKSRLTIVAFAMFGLFIGWISDASAQPEYFNAIGVTENGLAGRGCADAGCHDGAAVTRTCNGCHAHGAHSSSSKSDMNVVATTDATTYNVGDTITISIAGGYRTDWVRATVYNENQNMVVQSIGTCDSSTSTGNACSEGDPLTITLTSTANVTGTHMWTVGLYMNDDDSGGSAGGENGTIVTDVLSEGWLRSSNANHGEEIVAIQSFTVTDSGTGGGGTTSSGGGGGSLSWPVLGLLLFGVFGMLARDSRAKLMVFKESK